MKKLVFFTAIILAACTKSKTTTNNQTIYYRLQEVDVDGKVTTSPIRYVKLYEMVTTIKDGGHHEQHDGDDDDSTLPIKLETFVVTKINNNQIRIDWEADNEQCISYYIIEKSTDSKNWVARLKYIPDLSSKYTIIDTYE